LATTTKSKEDRRETQAQFLLSWRQEKFEKDLKFEHKLAMKLADSDADWHHVEKLLKAGCSHATAFKIVRPL
jgi:hypothetical protein